MLFFYNFTVQGKRSFYGNKWPCFKILIQSYMSPFKCQKHSNVRYRFYFQSKSESHLSCSKILSLCNFRKIFWFYMPFLTYFIFMNSMYFMLSPVMSLSHALFCFTLYYYYFLCLFVFSSMIQHYCLCFPSPIVPILFCSRSRLALTCCHVLRQTLVHEWVELWKFHKF